MPQTAGRYDPIIERFCAWAQAQDDIRVAIIIGSQARANRPADRWSDLDMIVVVERPERYLAETDWLNEIGTPRLTFIERQAVGDGRERRVIFDPDLDVDFSMVPAEGIQRILENGLPPELVAIFRRGYRVVMDKDGIGAQLASFQMDAPAFEPPDEAAFQNLCKDYWYHTVWMVKKLLRGEVWTAQSCLNGYMNRLLLQLLEWHARAHEKADTWHNGRFLEQWADPRAVDALRHTTATYDPADIWRALQLQMELFRWLAEETAACWRYQYPSDADRYATEWVKASPLT